MSESERAGRITEALGAEQSPLRDEGVSLLVGFFLDRPVADLIDPEQTSALILDALTEPNAQRVIERHLSPAWDRHRDRARRADERVGDALDDLSRAEVESILTSLEPPPANWAREAIDPALLRQLLAPVIQNTLTSFARKLPLVGLGGASGEASGVLGGIAGRLKKRVEKSAEQLADVGRSVGRAVTGDLDARLQKTAREFSLKAVGEARDALRERLRSEEGQQLLGEMRAGAFEHLLESRVAEIMGDVDSLPRERIEALVPKLVAHNAGRELLAEAVREEVATYLGIEGGRTVSELLVEAGLLDPVSAVLQRQLDLFMRELARTEATRDWIGKLLAL